MKSAKFYLLFFIILGIIGCNNTNPVTPKGKKTQSGDLIPYNWMKFEIVNNTNESVGYELSLIDVIFDISNDTRNDLSVDLRQRSFPSKKINDMNKFEQVFNEELEQKTLYTNYYDSTGDNALTDMTYNPLQEYYDWGGEDIKGILDARSSKKYYCWNIRKGEYGISAVYSVIGKISVGDKKFIVPGWSQSLYKFNAANDETICHNLEIFEDVNNPQNETNAVQSPSLSCDCYELTIEINSDTSSDIVITKNCVNTQNDK